MGQDTLVLHLKQLSSFWGVLYCDIRTEFNCDEKAHNFIILDHFDS